MAQNNPNETPPQVRGLLGRQKTPSGRLPSIRTPRDLTLGGVQKKTYKPNIPVRRDKAREEVGETSSQPRQSSGGRNKESGRGRGRGRGRGQGEYIQSHSIFEQGPAEGFKPRGGGSIEAIERAPGGGGGGGRAASRKERKEQQSIQDSKDIIDKLLRDDFVSGVGDVDPDLPPVNLPLLPVNKKEVKTETKIKVEPGTEEDGEEDKAEVDKVVMTTDSPIQTAAQLFTQAQQSELGEMMFIQLPDTLPGNPHQEDDNKPGTSQTSQQLEDKMRLCTLSDFSEGYIGKLQVHKSGRTTLQLGNVSLDVTMGTPSGFLQDVVSIKTQEKTGDISILGHLKHKVICVPDLDTLLDQS